MTTPGDLERPNSIAARPRRVVAIAMFAVVFAAYIANGRTVDTRQAYDNVPNRLLPFAVLGYGSVTFDDFYNDFAKIGGYRGYLQVRRDSIVSFYPLGITYVVLPIYSAYYVFLELTGPVTHDVLFAASETAEKVTAAAIAATAAAILFLVLSTRTSRAAAMIITLVFALGTSMWATASQLLWQHGPVVLCLICSVGFLGMGRRRGAFLAGVALGIAFATRPQTLPFALAGACAVSLSNSDRRLRLQNVILFCVAFILPVAPCLWLNYYYYGTILGGYAHAGAGFSLRGVAEGTAGLLISPNRGLLVTTPVAVLGFLGMASGIRKRDPILLPYSIAAVIYLVLHGAFYTWAGGWSYGSRYSVEMLPVLALALPEALPRISTSFRRLAVLVAVTWSVAFQLVGAFCYSSSRWPSRMGPNLEAAAWSTQHVEAWEDLCACNGDLLGSDRQY